MKMHTISLLFMGLLAAQTTQAAKYNITELPVLPGGTFSTGSGINKAGQVVGTGDDANGNHQAVVWTNGVATLPLGDFLDFSAGTAINNSGVAIGQFFLDLGGVFAIGPNIDAEFTTDEGPVVGALNDSNVIVGELRGHPAVWAMGTIDFNSQGLPNTPNNEGAGVSLNGINAAGVVVGQEFDVDTAGNLFSIALRWTPANSSDIGSKWNNATLKVLAGLGGRESSAAAINNNGWIVGWARLGNGRQHAALWEPTTSAFDLGTLGGNQSLANGLNSMGDVAGTAQTSSGAWHAVLWTHKHFVAVDLNNEISSTWAKEVTLTSAVGTNDRCMVLANGVNNKTGNEATFVLSLADQSLCNNP